MSYVLDEDSGVWVREAGGGISYSDGPARERRIYDLIAGCEDRSVFSSEIGSRIGGWASEYHLTPKRHFILKGLDLKPGQSVLELGCGCGAITRYLGELGMDVTSVEGGLGRAKTARLRCADLDNVTVYADDFTQFESDKTYDWVLYIGVLEYAPMFNDAADPFKAYIDVAAKHLTPDGKIVVAIENKVGVKYWNGANEDHLRRPYFGINDLYGKKTPTTFSKRELSNLLGGYGFDQQEFFYAFPDYKICDALISEAGEEADDFLAHQLILTSRSRSYGKNHIPSFHDGLSAATLEKAGLLGEMANSFVFVSSRVPFAKTDKLAFIHNLGKRNPVFTCETEFAQKSDGVSVTKRRHLAGTPGQIAAGPFVIRHTTEAADYVSGETEASSILRTFIRGARTAEMVSNFTPWAQHLLDNSRSDDPDATDVEDWKIEGRFVDAMPFNFIRTDGGLHLIDTEWRVDEEIPLGWPLARGVRVMFRPAISGLGDKSPDYNAFLKSVVASIGLTISDASIKRFMLFEKRFGRQAIRGPAIKNPEEVHPV